MRNRTSAKALHICVLQGTEGSVTVSSSGANDLRRISVVWWYKAEKSLIMQRSACENDKRRQVMRLHWQMKPTLPVCTVYELAIR